MASAGFELVSPARQQPQIYALRLHDQRGRRSLFWELIKSLWESVDLWAKRHIGLLYTIKRDKQVNKFRLIFRKGTWLLQ